MRVAASQLRPRSFGPVPDGAAFCAEALRAPRKSGRRVVVFDIDNTLVDTRHRTLRALHAFGFTHARLEHVAPNNRDTFRLLGITDPEVQAAFHAHWLSFFWDSRNWQLDRPIAEMVRLAKQARAAGFEIVYLTGRVDNAATMAQLRRLGLPAHERTVVTKPAVGVKTDRFKREWLAKLQRHAHVGWFITEGRRDLAALVDLGLPLVRLEFPHEPEEIRLPSGLPVFSLSSLK